MEWDQGLFTAFMIAVVGNLFAISTLLLWLTKKADVKPKRRNKREDNPGSISHDSGSGVGTQLSPFRKHGKLNVADGPAKDTTRGSGDPQSPFP